MRETPERAPELERAEEKSVEERRSPGAEVTYETIRLDGERELARTTGALGWSGLAAGLAMGFSLVAEGLLRAHLPPAQWSPLVARLGYAMGFLIVVLGSQELFTENTVKAVVPFLARRTAESLRHLVRLWTVVLVANLAGALLFAVVVARTEVFSPAARLAFEETARAAMEGGFWLKVLRGVFAGWLIALMVWMLPAAESARVAVVVIVTYLVALGGLTHVVVGSVEAFYLASLGRIGWGAALGGYTLPALIGNTLGGVVLVAALNHAQAAKPA